MRRMGIDPGLRRVGVALSDPDGRFASPHSTVKCRDEADAARQLSEVARAEDVAEIVVGLPLRLNGTEGLSARRARRLAGLLEQKLDTPIILWDERLSTVAAERALREGGVRAREQRRVVDRVAASWILQSYLDSKQPSISWTAEDMQEPQPAPDENPRRRGRARRSKRRR